MVMKRSQIALLSTLGSVLLASCEILDNDVDKHAGDAGTIQICLEEVAAMLSSIPLEAAHLDEVFDAASSSSGNGYDEEYPMKNLFETPGHGVGEPDVLSRSGNQRTYDNPLRNLIEEYLQQSRMVKSGAGPDEYIDALISSDIQIYWPFSDKWDGETLPIITFDPEDGADVNVGYRLFQSDDGTRRVEEVIVDEETAEKVPVWVVNRNSDAEYTTLEVLRRDDPAWGEGGGTIIVKPGTKASSGRPLQTLILKDFTMNRHYDTWFAGASEFFVKTGSLDDFTASTEAELRLYNPMITDFMIVVKRSQLGKPFRQLWGNALRLLCGRIVGAYDRLAGELWARKIDDQATSTG